MAEHTETVVLIDADVVVRASLGAYLRDCGLRVIEAVDIDEARTVIAAHAGAVDLVLCDAATVGTQDSFAFMTWVRQNHPDVAFLFAGTVSAAASLAGEICEKGPQLSKPYDHSIVADSIRRALAGRTRDSAG